MKISIRLHVTIILACFALVQGCSTGQGRRDGVSDPTSTPAVRPVTTPQVSHGRTNPIPVVATNTTGGLVAPKAATVQTTATSQLTTQVVHQADWVATDRWTMPDDRKNRTDAPRLRSGLQLCITVLVAGEKEIDEPVKRISEAGTISLPLIGLVKCDGLTLEDLTQKLTLRYAEFLQDPIVDVGFVVGVGLDAISPWGQITVLGRVKQPGQINIPPTRDISLSKAIQMAGGLDTSAKITNILITRRTASGGTRQMDINFQAVGLLGSVEKDLPLQDGDVIFVPESVF